MKFSLSGDFLNSNKILFHFAPILNEYINGKTDFMPVAIEIHPTEKCNHRCIHCSYMSRNEKRQSLPEEIMENLINSVIDMGVKGVFFSGGGEPTLYPDLKKHIEKLYNNGVECALITNGSYLEKSGLIEIANMFNYIAVSVPSTVESTFSYITKSDRFNEVLSVAEMIKNRHGEMSPVIGARVVITSVNFSETIEILNTLKKRNFDYALFKIVRDYEDRGLGIKEDEEKKLKELIESAENLDEKFTNLKNIFQYRECKMPGSKCITNELGFIANVDSDGRVYPNIVEIGNNDFNIGDLNVESLQNIWNSEKHLKVKEISNKKWENRECKNCRAISYNSIMFDLMSKLPKEFDCFI